MIAGTRVPVDVVVGKLGAGMSVDEVADEYGIDAEDVRAALRYAATQACEVAPTEQFSPQRFAKPGPS